VAGVSVLVAGVLAGELERRTLVAESWKASLIVERSWSEGFCVCNIQEIEIELMRSMLQTHGRFVQILFVFASQHNVLRIESPIDGKHPVEMVDFVLKKLGESSLRFEPFPLAMFVKENNLDGVIPLNVGEDVRERKAIIPEPESFSALPDDRRIDERTGIFKIDVYDFLRGADLRRCNTSAESPA
jgi:hypothetical protein